VGGREWWSPSPSIVGLANDEQQQLLSQFGVNQMHKPSECEIQKHTQKEVLK